MKYFYLFALTITALIFSACNTMKGVGQDVEAAGRGVTGASEKVQEDLQN